MTDSQSRSFPTIEDILEGRYIPAAEDILEATRRWVLSEFSDFHKNPPTVLYHYTKPEGLMGMLGGEHPCLRATHTAFVNDPRELVYAEETMTEFFKLRRTAYSDSNDLRGKVYDELLPLLPTLRQASDFFVFSMSQKDDDLSQWQAYAAGGYGYVIGFRSAEMAGIYPHCRFSKFCRCFSLNSVASRAGSAGVWG